MEEKLLRLIYDYSFDYKLGDKTFIERVNDILFNYYNITNNDVKEVYFYDNINSRTLASYCFNKKKLSFNIANIYKASKSNKLSFLNESDYYLFHNFYILSCIFHEYIHIFQRREMEFYGNNFFTNDIKKLLNYSFLFKDIEIRRKLNIYNIYYDSYKLYHDYFPIERMALIKEYKQMLKLIKLDSTFNTIFEDYYQYRYFNMLLFGYGKDRNTSPIEEYLFKVNLNYLYENFSFYDKDNIKLLKKVKQKYSVNERLLYGFPIDKKEKIDLLENNINACIKLSKHF